MIAPLELVTGMELTPQACILCANNPVDEVTGEQQQHIFAPGVDVNWGDSVYICNSCGQIIADLLGRATTDGFDKLTNKYDELLQEHIDLQEKHEKAKAFIERIKDGNKAIKDVKSGKVTV
jgi:hypothetical protein